MCSGVYQYPSGFYLCYGFAGFVVLIGIALSLTVHPYWLGLSAFAGLNMLQAAFTGSCPLVMLLRRAGVPPGSAFR